MLEKLPSELRPERFSSLSDLLVHIRNEHGPLPAFSSLGKTMTFAEMDDLSSRFASYLQHEAGLCVGDKIAVQLPNLLQFPVAVYGAIKAGLIVVTTNPLYTAREMRHQFRDSGVKSIVILENFCDKLESILSETEIETVIVTRLGDLQPPFRRGLLNLVAKHIRKLVPAYNIPGHIPFMRCLGDSHSREIEAHPSSGDDIAVILYTGGTTGVAKGAMLSHRNLIANMMQLRARCLLVLDDKKETLAAPLPLYHSYAFLMHCLIMPFAGIHSVLILNPRDTSAFISLLYGKDITGIIGINTLYLAFLNHQKFNGDKLRNLKLCGAGGMALSSSVMEQWQKATGSEIIEGYGLTECSPGVTVNIPGKVRPGTVGPPLPETELKVVDDDGAEMPRGEVGELWVRGPQVMLGYYRQPEETAASLDENGWFKTGDYVSIDADGYVTIVERKKDMILVSGFNVYPSEVEDWVNRHPGIVESAAVGVPSESTGEAVRLFVVRRIETVEAEDVIQHCKQGLTAYKIPREVCFVPELPKSIIGKVLRRELRE